MITICINSEFVRYKIYSEEHMKKYRKSRKESGLKDIVIHPRNQTETGYFYSSFVGDFRSVPDAKIYIAKQRLKFLEKNLYYAPARYHNDVKVHEDTPTERTHRGEAKKTKKWLLEQSEKYPEYFL